MIGTKLNKRSTGQVVQAPVNMGAFGSNAH